MTDPNALVALRSLAECEQELRTSPKCWLITGVAGFIGSNLLERLLKLNQYVVGADNFSTGHRRNLDEVKSAVESETWSRFQFREGDITNAAFCAELADGAGTGRRVEFVLHQAALGSVPRSIENPLATNAANVTGFLNVLWAAKSAGVERFVYAASSSTYGDHPGLPKVEDRIGRPLSPYAVTKFVNELYADVFSRTYGLTTVGLRYFNVFGRRQDPNGQYAAVIPRWVDAMLSNRDVVVFGDGSNSRDFCYIDNVVQANILAAVGAPTANLNRVFNVAFGERTTLLELAERIRSSLRTLGVESTSRVKFESPRVGDVLHSLADISLGRRLLGYSPVFSVDDGLRQAVAWYRDQARG